MAQFQTIRLTRGDPSCSWGFRLQGGKDFGTPLLIQKVNVGSLAERAGLQVGDAVIKVNNKDVSNERHKDAQDTIIGAGNSFEITVQRGGLGTWKPEVIPVGSVPSPNPFKPVSPIPVTKTSLASNNRQPSPRIPHGFNAAVKPFSPQMNGSSEENGPIKAIVNKQYNSPVGIYSDESIAETLSAQAEVLAGGVLGVNFKKNEKNYNAESSEVFKMLQEAEKEPKSPEPDVTTNGVSSPVAGLRHVSAPQTKPSSNETSLTPGKNICADCERLIVGVFVRIKDKNLHVECFKCATCGTSLKNVGYYSINNKLYCDIHAKMVARQNPPASNLEPVTVSPFQHQNAVNKPFSPVNFMNGKPASPQPSTLTPLPFHPPRLSPTPMASPISVAQNASNFNGTNTFKPSQTNNNNSSVFRPGFQAAQSRPFSKETDTKQVSNPSCQYSSLFGQMPKRLPFLKPKSESCASAFMPVMKSTTNVRHTTYDCSTVTTTTTTTIHEKNDGDSRLETVFEGSTTENAEAAEEGNGASLEKRPSICSQEISRVLSENKCTRDLSSLIEHARPDSPAPSESADEFTSIALERRHREFIVSTPRSVRSLSPCQRPPTPGQVVVFPPQVPQCFRQARVASPAPMKSSSEARASPTIKISQHGFSEPGGKCEKSESQSVCLGNSPSLKFEPGILTSLMTTAPTRPFTPVDPPRATIFQEDVPLPEESIPYFPSNEDGRTSRGPSPLVTALTIGSERSYSPLPTNTDFHELLGPPLPDPSSPPRPSLAQALAVAPVSDADNDQISQENKVPDLGDDPSLILTQPILDPIVSAKKKETTYYSSLYRGEAFFPPIANELKAKFEEKRRKAGSHSSRKSTRSVSRGRSPEECQRAAAALQRPSSYGSTGLHKPVSVPHYQHCVRDLSSRNSKKSPTPSRRSTPMAANQTNLSQNFDATVSVQQKIFQCDVSSKVECQSVITSAKTFLSQTADISEKVAPVLGYQPCPLVERPSFEKIEKCVQNIREGRIMERCLSPNRAALDCSTTPGVCAVQGSARVSPSKDKNEKPKRRSRSRTCRTPDRSASVKPSPLALPSCSEGGSSIIVTSTGAQCFRPPPSPTSGLADSFKSPNIAAASLISRQLSKTLLSLTSCDTSKNLPNLTSASPNSNPQTGTTAVYNNSSLKNTPSSGSSAGFSAPKRGKGVWNPQNMTPGARIPLCAHCNSQIRGPFITALGKIWCPEHFVCVNQKCRRSLLDIGFVEEPTGLYCEYCFEQYLAPNCGQCNQKVKGDCLNAIGKHFHPDCFTCAYCHKRFGNNPFFLEDGLPYCENDWNELFTTKCFACGFPIEAGDRWVEALNNNYHSPCFNCTVCKTNLEGQSFYAKGGRPFCKNHSH